MRDTPLVRSTTSRWPRSTSGPRVTTTLPLSVTVFDFMSNTPLSPVAVEFLLCDDHAAFHFHAADLLLPVRTGLRGLHAAALRSVLIVEDHQRPAAQVGIALHQMHVAGEGGLLLLVAHFE